MGVAAIASTALLCARILAGCMVLVEAAEAQDVQLAMIRVPALFGAESLLAQQQAFMPKTCVPLQKTTLLSPHSHMSWCGVGALGYCRCQGHKPSTRGLHYRDGPRASCIACHWCHERRPGCSRRRRQGTQPATQQPWRRQAATAAGRGGGGGQGPADAQPQGGWQPFQAPEATAFR
jgi:hypothetical protein